MFANATIGITEHDRAFAFYRAVLAPLDLAMHGEDKGSWAWVKPGT